MIKRLKSIGKCDIAKQVFMKYAHTAEADYISCSSWNSMLKASSYNIKPTELCKTKYLF